MADFKVGVVTHYYDKIGVAIIDLSADLAVNDKIKFMRGGENLFEQNIDSIQIEHEKVDSASKGQIVGVKTTQEVKDGAEVFKVTA
ncbi:hypothetical protein HY045_02125 [Candidatus Woesebacteria bacterium]|nr:hypothetical protein [Candidatus Woesebacteria bacterium]